MAQTGLSFTKRSCNRSHSAGSTLLLFLQKTLFTFLRVMLLVPLFFLAAASDLQARAQSVSAYVSSAAPGESELPDAPSPAPPPQQSSPPSVPFLSPRLNRPLQPMDVGDKFKYLVEPAFGPRSFFTNVFSTGYAWQILPAATLMIGALELRRTDGSTETVSPVPELKASGASPLPFYCTRILVIAALTVAFCLYVWAMPWSSPLSIERTVATAQSPSQTSPEPRPPVLLATHIYRPASIT
jgi:hypothetical protein